MTYTRDKLNEAKYFLGEMKRVSQVLDNFRYELTSFLAAIRSVTQIMQKEFTAKSGFSDWYSKKQEEMKSNSILKYLHRQRAITYHERPVLPYPIGTKEKIVDGAWTNIILAGTGSPLDLSSSFMIPSSIQPTTRVKYYFDDIDNKEKDVITICQEAVSAIENIVNECESTFSERYNGTDT